MPELTLDETNHAILTRLPYRTADAISTLRDIHQGEISNLTFKTIVPALYPQQLPEGILSNPTVYYRQEGDRSCSLANFEMVFTAITGRKVNEQSIMVAASKTGRVRENNLRLDERLREYRDIAEDTLLTVFQTPAFKKEFPDMQVGILKLVGADFEDIAELTEKLQAKAAGMNRSLEAYCIATIDSEALTDGWHNAVLLSANEESVITHDPSKNLYYDTREPIGKPNKQSEKVDFIRRWGKAHLRSDYIFALKPQEFAA